MIDCGCDEILLPQGSDGVNGKNAFTVTTAQFVQPGVGNSITINVSDSLQNTNQWAIVGQIIKITDSASNGGWYQVTSITGTNQITATQLDYPGTSGSTILVGAGVSPAGLRGPIGTPGTNGLRGDVGPANQLSSVVGVTQVPSTTPASASISGSYPNQKLNLSIPKGADGAIGTGLIGSVYTSANQLYAASVGVYQSLDTFLGPLNVTLNAFNALPTVGSVVKSTMYIKARFTKFGAGRIVASKDPVEISYVPVLINTAGGVSFLLPDASEQANLISGIDDRILYQPSVVSTNATHGQTADPAAEFAWARTNLPVVANSAVNGGIFPAVYTKITTTVIRTGTSSARTMVEYTSTSRYGTYTAVYEPSVTLSQNFTSAEAFSIGFKGTIRTDAESVTITRLYHTIEKSYF
jgi:hypothetical protein